MVESTVTQLIPGFGATWLAGEDFNLFASVHRGFNPPGPGSGAEPEESLNLEAGLRWHPGAIQAELVGFWNEYDNLVGTCTASTGGGCQIGDQFDGGKARVRGIEASLAHDFGRAHGWALKVPARIGYTYTDAQFRSSFSSGFGEWGTVEAGDRLPYLPEHALNLQFGVEGERWRVTESAFVVDLAAGWRLTPDAELFARVENLTDETWIASRRPAGARPGMPRMTMLGVKVGF
jgi:Fe(3+) dicitrate transport protein